MNDSTGDDAIAWYCVKTQPKREHVAAASLRARMCVEVFCPRITYLKKTVRGKVKFTEALFPGYVFSRVDVAVRYRHLISLHGVTSVVRYGTYFPVVPTIFIEELRASLGEETYQAEEPELRPGDEVVVTEGPFKNFEAVIKGEVPATKRVALLLDFLGRQVEIDLPAQAILARNQNPKAIAARHAG